MDGLIAAIDTSPPLLLPLLEQCFAPQIIAKAALLSDMSRPRVLTCTQVQAALEPYPFLSS